MKVISIEGIDGTGKTSILKGLEKSLNKEDICYVSFPTEWFYEEYKKLEKKCKSTFDEEVNNLQTKDKERKFNEMREKGYSLMICDRFDVSQKVYNGSSLGVATVDLTVRSDKVIYLNLPVETVLERIGSRGQEDCLGYEQEDKLRILKERYENILAEEYPYEYSRVDINYGDTKEEVLGKVKVLVEEFIKGDTKTFKDKQYILIKNPKGELIVVVDRLKAEKEEVAGMIGRYVFQGYLVEYASEEEYKKEVEGRSMFPSSL